MSDFMAVLRSKELSLRRVAGVFCEDVFKFLIQTKIMKCDSFGVEHNLNGENNDCLSSD